MCASLQTEDTVIKDPNTTILSLEVAHLDAALKASVGFSKHFASNFDFKDCNAVNKDIADLFRVEAKS
tara:strand:+ start:352 stop:555 length:204 start_codon:yes stop_codon:yes gene_type:complete